MKGAIRILSTTALLAVSLSAAAQTCNGSIPLTRPDSRYTNNYDGTVTDTVTGLMWKQCPEGLSGAGCATGAAGTYTWQQALEQAETVNDGGGFATHTDWRLPNLKELKSLAETACYSPAINETYFPATPSAVFWSSSPYASVATGAWVVNFYNGFDDWSGKGFNGYHVRLVRAGQ